MFGSTIFLVAAASTVIGDLDPFERATVQEAAKRVSKCGLGSVIVTKDDRQRAVILTAANPPPLNDDQLACADGAASFYVLKLPAETQKRYDAIRRARLTASLVANARRWLSEHGLLARLPAYAPGVTDAVIFTQQIEDLCGPLAKGAFQSSYGPHVISPEWSDDNEKRGRKGVEASQCLTNATIATRYDYSIILKDRSAELKKAAH